MLGNFWKWLDCLHSLRLEGSLRWSSNTTAAIHQHATVASELVLALVYEHQSMYDWVGPDGISQMVFHRWYSTDGPSTCWLWFMLLDIWILVLCIVLIIGENGTVCWTVNLVLKSSNPSQYTDFCSSVPRALLADSAVKWVDRQLQTVSGTIVFLLLWCLLFF